MKNKLLILAFFAVVGVNIEAGFIRFARSRAAWVLGDRAKKCSAAILARDSSEVSRLMFGARFEDFSEMYGFSVLQMRCSVVNLEEELGKGSKANVDRLGLLEEGLNGDCKTFVRLVDSSRSTPTLNQSRYLSGCDHLRVRAAAAIESLRSEQEC